MTEVWNISEVWNYIHRPALTFFCARGRLVLIVGAGTIGATADLTTGQVCWLVLKVDRTEVTSCGADGETALSQIVGISSARRAERSGADL